MSDRYYFFIHYLPKQVDNEMLAGRCISVLHGFISNDRNQAYRHQIGISFPHWDVQTVGNMIAFVSTNETILTGLMFQPYFSMMMTESLFEISDIFKVPQGAHQLRFIRNRTIDKIFVGSKRKRVRRAIKRAQADMRIYTPMDDEERNVELFHSVPMKSHSSNQEYCLFIQMEPLGDAEPDDNYGSYGFASNAKWQGTVPRLKL